MLILVQQPAELISLEGWESFSKDHLRKFNIVINGKCAMNLDGIFYWFCSMGTAGFQVLCVSWLSWLEASRNKIKHQLACKFVGNNSTTIMQVNQARALQRVLYQRGTCQSIVKITIKHNSFIVKHLRFNFHISRHQKSSRLVVSLES